MDKSWIYIEDRLTNDSFKLGLENFLEFAYTNKALETKIKCPCTKCRNSSSHSRDDVYYHIMAHGFLQGYTNWVHQGEEPFYLQKNTVNASCQRKEHDDMQGMIRDGLLSSYHHGEYPENPSGLGTDSNFDEASRDETEDPLNNLSIVDEFKRMHLDELQRTNRQMASYERQKLHTETFHDWFKIHVGNMREASSSNSSSTDIEQDIMCLAAGPSKWARRYTGYIINGLRFHTKKRERRKKTQNSGVFLTAKADSFASSKDKNPKSGDISYYGVLQDIIEVRYTNELKFFLFKCDWIDYNVGLKHDENLTLVNFNHLLYKGDRIIDEPYILASQAQQCWYIREKFDSEWHIVMEMTPRSVFNVDPEVNEYESSGNEDEHFRSQEDETNITKEKVSWTRADVESVTVSRADNLLDDSDHEDVTQEDKDYEEEDFASESSDSSDDDDFFEDRIPLNENEDD